MRRSLMLVGVAVALTIGPGAAADTTSIEDAQDTGDVMDLATASHGHGEASGVLLHSISTFDEWTNESFVRAEIMFWIPDGDGSPDRILTIYRNRDDSLGGSIYKTPGGSGCGKASGYCEYGDLVGYARLYRSDERSLAAHVARRDLRKQLSWYRWKVFLHYPCDRSGQIPCSPPPPDTHKGRVRHDLK